MSRLLCRLGILYRPKSNNPNHTTRFQPIVSSAQNQGDQESLNPTANIKILPSNYTSYRMPLPGREVGPVRICQARFVLSNAPDKEGSVHNLEETTYIALVGVMKQLGDIAEYADEIFGSVYDIARQ